MGYATEAPPPEADGYRRLSVGDPAPWFQQATDSGPGFSIDLAAGRYVVLCFLMGAGDPAGQRALELVDQNPELFDDDKLSFFGVTVNWRDQHESRRTEPRPGVHFFWDFDLTASRLYGAVPAAAGPGVINVRRRWFVLDPMLRIVATVRFEKDGAERPAVLEILRNLPPLGQGRALAAAPPVLLLPNVFEPELCGRLVAAFDADGGEESGSLVQMGEQTISVHDYARKRRRDHLLDDWELAAEVKRRVQRRVVPEMAKAFQFQATQLERYLVGCYEEGGHFGPHRDNTTLVTAHRRFALSLNLTDDYQGGEIAFPEYGSHCYRPPVGTALVFSCSLLHRVLPVTRGRRYAFLPFVHDDAAAQVLARNHGAARDEQVTPPPSPQSQVLLSSMIARR